MADEGEGEGSSRLDRDPDEDDLRTLSDEDLSRALTMAQLKAQAEREAERQAEPEHDPDSTPASAPERARPRARDDELLTDPPRGDHHLGRFAGWEKGRRLRQVLLIGFAIAVVIASVIYWRHTAQARHERRHPLPEVEATIRPGTPREMTFSEGSFRASLGAEAPAINVLHLPDRDIVLAEGADTAHFKVEVVEGKTLRIKVLSGEVRELLKPGAEALLTE